MDRATVMVAGTVLQRPPPPQSDTLEHLTRLPTLHRGDVDIYQMYWAEEKAQLDEASSWAQDHAQGDWIKMGLHHGKNVYKLYFPRNHEKTAYCYAVVDAPDRNHCRWWVTKTLLGNDVVMCAPLGPEQFMPSHGWVVPTSDTELTAITPVVGPKLSAQHKIIAALSQRINELIAKEATLEATAAEDDTARRRAEATVIILQKEIEASKTQVLALREEVKEKDAELLSKDDSIVALKEELARKVDTEFATLAAHPLAMVGAESGADEEAEPGAEKRGVWKDVVDEANEVGEEHAGVTAKHGLLPVPPPPPLARPPSMPLSAWLQMNIGKPPPAIVPKWASVTHADMAFLHDDVREGARWGEAIEAMEDPYLEEQVAASSAGGTGGSAAKRKAEDLS